MIWAVLFFLGIILFVSLAGRRKKAVQVGVSKPGRSTPGRALSRFAVREAGNALDRDGEDVTAGGFAKKQAQGVGLVLAIDYENSSLERSSRTIVIDAVYGPSLDGTEYLLAMDSATHEVRTFRADRIKSARLESGEQWSDRFGSRIANWIRAKAGLELHILPFKGRMKAPLIIREVNASTGAERTRTGFATFFKLDLSGPSSSVSLHFTGPVTEGRKTSSDYAEYYIPPLRKNSWSIDEMSDGATGEVIEDVIVWARGVLGVNEFGEKI